MGVRKDPPPIKFLPPPQLMCELGNRALNRIYEARVDEMGVKRPQPQSSRWVRPPPMETTPKLGGGGQLSPPPNPPWTLPPPNILQPRPPPFFMGVFMGLGAP